MHISDDRKRLLGGIYEYVGNIVDYAIKNGRKIIIWGCGKGGAFLRHVICDVDARTKVTYYIDEHIVLPCGDNQNRIYRSSLLRYIKKEDYIIFLSIRNDQLVENYLDELGYKKNVDYYDVRSEIGASYLEYLEMGNHSLDFSYVTKEDRPDIYGGEYYESKPFDHSSIDHVFEEICALPCEMSFFDMGCGKGQILMMAAISGMKRIGGIDFNEDLVRTGRKNMKALKIAADIKCGDATKCQDLDDYNVFFMYNPFGEEAVCKVMCNIKESVNRRKRETFLVYGNPFYHEIVINMECVSLYKQVNVDLYDPILNIYRIGE